MTRVIFSAVTFCRGLPVDDCDAWTFICTVCDRLMAKGVELDALSVTRCRLHTVCTLRACHGEQIIQNALIHTLKSADFNQYYSTHEPRQAHLRFPAIQPDHIR